MVYRELTEACFGVNEAKKKDALYAITHDPIMKDLVPHFACFIKETVKHGLQTLNLSLLLTSILIVMFLLENFFIQNLDQIYF